MSKEGLWVAKIELEMLVHSSTKEEAAKIAAKNFSDYIGSLCLDERDFDIKDAICFTKGFPLAPYLPGSWEIDHLPYRSDQDDEKYPDEEIGVIANRIIAEQIKNKSTDKGK